VGIRLCNKLGNDFNLSNMSWAYLLNLGEIYGWRPEGTKKSKKYGCFHKWSGCYDSSEGQIICQSDTNRLAKSLLTAIKDEEFKGKSDELVSNIQNAIESSRGKELGYSLLTDVDINFIVEVSAFLESGDISIN
jgi:hypothetical protein